MGFTINSTSRVALKGMRIVYITEYEEETEVKAVTAASNMALASNHMSIAWETNAVKYSYEVFEKGTENKVASGEANGRSYNPCNLPAGEYTLKVTCLGDGVTTLDATSATEYDFKIENKLGELFDGKD